MLAPPNMGDDYGQKFNGIYPRLAEKYGLPLYPFVLDGVITDRALLLEDGMHPNTKGLQIMAERMLPSPNLGWPASRDNQTKRLRLISLRDSL